MTKLALSAAVFALIAVTGWGWLQYKDVAALEAKLLAAQVALAGCGATVTNINEDRKSDEQIDTIPDADLRDVPDHWMRLSPQ